MKTSERIQVALRFSLLSAEIIALFWLIWYLVAGQVPITAPIKITPTYTLRLSRWWDVLIVPICLFLLVWIFSSKRKRNEKWVNNFFSFLATTLILFLFIILSLALGNGLFFGLFIGLILCHLLGLFTGFWIIMISSLVLFFEFCSINWRNFYNWLLAK